MILVGPTSEQRGSAVRLHLVCQGGGEPPDEAEVVLDTYHKSGAERSIAFQGTYGEFRRIPDQQAPDAALAIRQRADLGEDYVIRLSVSVPACGPEPDPAAFESSFELECSKLWWYESA